MNHHTKPATTSAAALIHTRPSKLTMDAAFVVLFEGVPVTEGVDESVEEAVLEELEVLEAGPFVGLAGETDVSSTEADDDAPLADAAPPPKLGAATAVEGSTRAPVPHGMGSFESGWVALGGGTDWPLGEAMVKRVVHVWSVARGEEYWKK